MASDQTFVDYICEQAGLGSLLSYRKMFGEYALYLESKVVALVCDNQLFLKPTPEGRQLLGTVLERPPYPSAKPQFLIADELDDAALLQRLLQTTARALPAPQPKKAKTSKATPPAQPAARPAGKTKRSALRH
jgi:TfoX/Sxy family transcriptional regulator of competence genes